MLRKKSVGEVVNGNPSRFAISPKDGFELCVVSQHRRALSDYEKELKERMRYSAKQIQNANPHKKIDVVVFSGVQMPDGRVMLATKNTKLPGSRTVLAKREFLVKCRKTRVDAQVIYRKKTEYWAVSTKIDPDLINRDNLQLVQGTLDSKPRPASRKFGKLLADNPTKIKPGTSNKVMAALKRSAAR